MLFRGKKGLNATHAKPEGICGPLLKSQRKRDIFGFSSYWDNMVVSFWCCRHPDKDRGQGCGATEGGGLFCSKPIIIIFILITIITSHYSMPFLFWLIRICIKFFAILLSLQSQRIIIVIPQKQS